VERRQDFAVPLTVEGDEAQVGDVVSEVDGLRFVASRVLAKDGHALLAAAAVDLARRFDCPVARRQIELGAPPPEPRPLDR
jgi:hypothetical protein